MCQLWCDPVAAAIGKDSAGFTCLRLLRHHELLMRGPTISSTPMLNRGTQSDPDTM